MKLVEKMDAGAIYLQEAVALAADETTGSLQAKLTPIGARLLVETLRGLKEGTLVAQEQDERLATPAPILKKEDGLIDWNKSAVEIERRVRGLDPWPGSFTRAGGKLLKVHRARHCIRLNRAAIRAKSCAPMPAVSGSRQRRVSSASTKSSWKTKNGLPE